jgi:hypothetical protein
MNIGIEYTYFEDLIGIFYILNKSEIKFDYYKKPFVIEDNGNTYYFYDYNNVDKSIYTIPFNKCDLKIKAIYTFPNKYVQDNEYKKYYDKILFTKWGDDFIINRDKPLLEKFLNDGNVCLSAHVPDSDCAFSHENFLYDPLFGMIAYYYFYGYYFFNYYKTTNKKHLVGSYYAPLHINGRPRNWRNYVFDASKEILKDDLHAFSRKTNQLLDLINPPYRFNKWQSVHITGYSDYASSVCNIVFESSDIDSYGYISEKTLKSIIFCEEDIFFIWAGPIGQLQYLVDAGFWFLNLEFINKEWRNKTLVENTNCIKDATLETVRYLKQLKKEKKSNLLVHEHLMSLYGDKLKSNVENFNERLNRCQYKDDFIRILIE